MNAPLGDQFDVLYSDESRQRKQWFACWERWPDREVMAHPAYVELFSRPSDRAGCAVMVGEGAEVLYPFVLRPLAAEPWAEGDTAFDLVSPYGYGGAFAWGNVTPSVAEQFWASLKDWARHMNVACSFDRLSLFPEQTLPDAGTVRPQSTNVVRDLRLEEADLWRSYAHKVRKNVKRARESGVRVEVDLDGVRLQEFQTIYDDTMERRQAAPFYRFDHTFFSRLGRGLHGHVAWFFARRGHETLAAELVLVSSEHTYSFLGGTAASAFALRPNDLLKHEVILWSRAQGKKAYVLGGGYAPDDGILAYKRSFAPDGDRVFCVSHRTFDEETVERLCRRRSEWEAAKSGAPWHPRPGWFPPYRS